MKPGLEAYITELYAAGHLTIREAAERLGRSIGDTLDVLRERGVPGNLTASDVLESIERFT